MENNQFLLCLPMFIEKQFEDLDFSIVEPVVAHVSVTPLILDFLQVIYILYK